MVRILETAHRLTCLIRANAAVDEGLEDVPDDFSSVKRPNGPSDNAAYRQALHQIGDRPRVLIGGLTGTNVAKSSLQTAAVGGLAAAASYFLAHLVG